jgi:glucose/mannose transport system substrate-binding protein
MTKATKKLAGAVALALTAYGAMPVASAQAPAGAPLKATVIHWWTSGGESQAVKQFADAYNKAGGLWVDNAIAGADQSRATTINRIVGGNAPTAAQFNTSKQFRDFVDQGLLNNVDDVAIAGKWDQIMPPSILAAIKINGHFYAAPVDIHMPAWFFYSKAAYKKAGITNEPQTWDEFLAQLAKLKAAGVVPLAFGGQVWQEKITFDAIFAMVGGSDLYLKVYRDRDQKAVMSPAFKQVLVDFKKLKGFVDAGSPGRNWNDATAMVVSGKAGVQIMGDWAKGEFAAAKQVAGRDFGCFPGFGPKSPYIVAGDAFVFPKTTDANAIKAQKLLATTVTSPAAQVAFNSRKGAIPIRGDVDVTSLDICARLGLEIIKDKSRQLPNTEMLASPDTTGALQDVLTNYWNKNQSPDDAQKAFARALKDE